MTRAEIISYARTQLGVTYQHQARLVDVALDCAGLISVVGRHFGFIELSTPNYSRYADGVSLPRELLKYFDPIDAKDAQPGDVIVFWISKPDLPQHVGIKTDIGILHTHAGIGKVVEHNIDDNWLKRIHSALRFKGVE